MKRITSLAAVAALALGMTSFASAQSPFYPESTNSWQVESAQPAAAPAATSDDSLPRARFYPESTNSWQVEAVDTPAPAIHYGKTGKLRLKAPVKIEGDTLKPDNYYVRFVDSPDGHYVEFSKTVENYNAPEGMSPYQEKVVAEIPCTMEQLNAAVVHTELLPKTSDNVARLEIRGEKMVHLF